MGGVEANPVGECFDDRGARGVPVDSRLLRAESLCSWRFTNDTPREAIERVIARYDRCATFEFRVVPAPGSALALAGFLSVAVHRRRR